jgi:hypothetical protein
MKAVARALDEMNHQQRSANPQDKTTPKASATTGTVIHLKRPRRITLDAIEILGLAARRAVAAAATALFKSV